jgi:hypothetical protein
MMNQKRIIIFLLCIYFFPILANAQSVYKINEYGCYIIKNNIIEKLPINDYLMFPRPYLNYIGFGVTDKAKYWIYNMDTKIATDAHSDEGEKLYRDLSDGFFRDHKQGQSYLLWDRLRRSEQVSYNTLKYIINDYYFIDFIFSNAVDISGRYDPYDLWIIDEDIFVILVNQDRAGR